MLSAWGNKRIADMSRNDLIVALNQLYESYKDISRTRMLEVSRLKEIHYTHDQADSKMTP